MKFEERRVYALESELVETVIEEAMKIRGVEFPEAMWEELTIALEGEIRPVLEQFEWPGP